jgi:hypothetical protein
MELILSDTEYGWLQENGTQYSLELLLALLAIHWAEYNQLSLFQQDKHYQEPVLDLILEEQDYGFSFQHS